jgi:hypothetical protein
MGVLCTRVHDCVLGSVLVVYSAWLPYKVVARRVSDLSNVTQRL